MHVLEANYENESYYPLKEKSIIFLLITPKLSVLKVELSNMHFQPNSHSCDGKNPLLPHDIFYNEGHTHTKKMQKEISESLTIEMHVHILHQPAVIILLREAQGR